MANKRNSYKRRTKGNLKRLRIQLMAKCQRIVAARTKNGSFDTQNNDDCLVPEETQRSLEENGVSVEQEAGVPPSSHHLRHQYSPENVERGLKRSHEHEDPNEQAARNNNADGMETDGTEGKIQIVYCKTEPEMIEISEDEVNYDLTGEVQEIHETDTLQIASTSSNNLLPVDQLDNESDDEINDENSEIDDEIDNENDNERETFFNLCDSYLTGDLAELVKAQTKHLNLLNTESSLHKKHKDFIAFCWNLYLTSPQVYFVFQKVLGLPTPNALKDSMPISTELDETIMSVLESKVKNMTDSEKNCALVIYTVDLKAELFYNIKEDTIIGFNEVQGVQTKAAARSALVIAIRGIFVDWKQPIAYVLLSEYPDLNQIDYWITNVLIKLTDIGLNVRTFVSDFKPETYDLAKRKDITIDKPYLIIKDRVIYYIYDAAHLIKQVHDNFIQYHYQTEGKVVKYNHIVRFYNMDKKKSSRIAPQLTDDHIKPSKVKKTKAILSTQVFSNEVATGVSMYVDCKIIVGAGKDTAKFIKVIHNLYQALNCSILEDYEYKRSFLDDTLLFFQSLKVVHPKNRNDVTSTVKFIENFQITIMSVLLLIEDLKFEGITCLPTKRLNLGNENEKTKNGETTPPTTKQFVAAFQKGFFANIVKPTKGTNCDMGRVIASLKKLEELFKIPNESQASVRDEYDTIEIASHHYNKLDIPVKHSIVFISGFLLRKCLEHHRDCEILRAYAKPPPDHDYTGNDRYERYQNYTKDTNSDLLVVPCDDFVDCINRLENIFRDSFERQHINRKIAYSIYREIQDVNVTPPPCPCFPTLFMKKLFIRTRMFYTMKFMTIAKAD